MAAPTISGQTDTDPVVVERIPFGALHTLVLLATELSGHGADTRGIAERIHRHWETVRRHLRVLSRAGLAELELGESGLRATDDDKPVTRSTKVTLTLSDERVGLRHNPESTTASLKNTYSSNSSSCTGEVPMPQSYTLQQMVAEGGVDHAEGRWSDEALGWVGYLIATTSSAVSIHEPATALAQIHRDVVIAHHRFLDVLGIPHEVCPAPTKRTVLNRLTKMAEHPEHVVVARKDTDGWRVVVCEMESDLVAESIAERVAADRALFAVNSRQAVAEYHASTAKAEGVGYREFLLERAEARAIEQVEDERSEDAQRMNQTGIDHARGAQQRLGVDGLDKPARTQVLRERLVGHREPSPRDPSLDRERLPV